MDATHCWQLSAYLAEAVELLERVSLTDQIPELCNKICDFLDLYRDEFKNG